MKQTAIEWLVENMDIKVDFFELERLRKVFERAKEMEKNQIIDAKNSVDNITGEQYYNKTFREK
jgi:hypothetical protein